MKKVIHRLWNASALPQSLDFWLKQLKINYQTQTPTVKVLDKHIIDDVVKLVLKPSKSFGEFRVGQHLRLKVLIDAIGRERCYSISNLPTKKGLIELFIKVQGEVSNAIRSSVKVGDVLDVSKPFGESDKQAFNVFIAGGIGITAVWPLFLNAQKTNPNAKLLYLTRLPDEGIRQSIDGPLFKEIRQSHAFTDGRARIVGGRGYLTSKNSDVAPFSEVVKDEDKVFSCGSASFNEKVQLLLKELDVKHECSVENFSSTPLSSSSSEKKEVTIKLLESGKELIVSNQIPLLDSLLNAGLKPQYGCKQGICHQCTCRVAPSSILNGVNKTIQLCTTFPGREMELEL